MPRRNLALELPEGLVGRSLDEALNERLRLISEALDILAVETTSAGAVISTGSGSSLILLSLSGILAIQSDVAPRIALPAARTVSELIAIVKQAPTGGALTLRVRTLLGGVTTDFATLSIPDGSLRATVTSPGSLPADADVLLDIQGVGLTYPGRDLSVLLRLA